MDVSNLDSLLVTTPVLVQCLDQLELKPEQSSGIAPLDANERFIQMPLTVLKELEAGESGRHDLNGDEGLEFTLGFNGGDQRDRCIESPFVKHVERSWAQCRDELRQHDVDELVGKRLPEDVPQRGFVRFQLCRRQNQVAVLTWLYDARRSFLSNGVCWWAACFDELFATGSGRRQYSHSLALGNFICQPSSIASFDMPRFWHLVRNAPPARKAKLVRDFFATPIFLGYARRAQGTRANASEANIPKST
jgi:hypothetical protein